jgi:serine/threonine protein kinase
MSKRGERLSPEYFLKLDDSDVWEAVKAWAGNDSGDSILRDLARRLLSRDLFKVFLLSDDVNTRLRDVDCPTSGQNLRMLVKARLGCSLEDAEYYYAFDSKSFNVIGRPQEPWHDVWIMESGALGFEFKTLRDYWQKEVRSPESAHQHLLLVHPEVVQDLAGIVERLSFPAESAKDVRMLPETPSPYRLVAPLGSEGAWKEVYVAANSAPGSAPENIVALKRYKTMEGESTTIDRDVRAINLLANPHQNLSTPRLLRHEKGETWILEPLWTGSLEDLIKKHGPRRDILEIFEIAEQLFLGLAWLHEYNLRHTDIKPDNCGILGVGSGRKRYVLGDFGCLSSSPNTMPTDTRLLGTLRTRAPEVLSRRSISLKSDVWAMAATVYAVCALEYPFMPLDAPHHDSNDRIEREKTITVGIEALVGQFRQNVADLLPPILGDQLRPCFEDEASRLSASEAAESFQTKYAELARENTGLFRTAWQRAEDVAQLFDAEEFALPQHGFQKEQHREINELITTYKDFVPAQVRTRLKRIIS